MGCRELEEGLEDMNASGRKNQNIISNLHSAIIFLFFLHIFKSSDFLMGESNFLFFNVYLFIFETETESWGEIERQTETDNTKQVPHASRQPDVGLESTNHEIMT